MKKFLLSLLIASVLVGCNNSNKPKETESQTPSEIQDTISQEEGPRVSSVQEYSGSTEHSAKNSLDYYGEYEGTFPLEGSAGMKVKLTLAKDNTYRLDTDEQMGAGVESLTGIFTWGARPNTIILNSEKDNNGTFFVAEGRLFLLDTDGKRVDGKLADQYTLKQTKTY